MRACADCGTQTRPIYWRGNQDLCDQCADKRTVFVDGDRVTPGTERCTCTIDCEFPCWQRIGLTTEPCCSGCAPLPSVG